LSFQNHKKEKQAPELLTSVIDIPEKNAGSYGTGLTQSRSFLIFTLCNF
jgi:hypothetical protein